MMFMGYKGKKTIYEKNFFHAVYNLKSEVITRRIGWDNVKEIRPLIYVDGKLVSSFPKEIMVGFEPSKIEFPEFPEFGTCGHPDFDKNTDCMVDFMKRFKEVGGRFLPEETKNTRLYPLYLCLSNIQTFYWDRTTPVTAFEKFVQAAAKINQMYREPIRRTSSLSKLCFAANSEKVTPAVISETNKGIAEAMSTMLKKMIDPCFVMQTGKDGIGDIGRGYGDDSPRRAKADSYCDVFCKFLKTAQKIFFKAESESYSKKCASIQSGKCDVYAQTCYCTRKSGKSVVGPVITRNEPMLLCNNLIRLQLNP